MAGTQSDQLETYLKWILIGGSENECRQMLFHESSKLGSSIIDFHSEKVLWHEKNDFKFFDVKNSWPTSKTREYIFS